VTYDLRARPLLVILLLAVAAAGAGLLALHRVPGLHHSSSNPGTTKPATTQPTAAQRAEAKAAALRAAQARARAEAKAKAEARARAKAAAAAAAHDRLPAAIRRALAANNVVVVALYDPKAKIDGLAMREARAGADQAGSAFVPVDVRRDGVASLNARYGVVQDPAVLVLRPPGSLVVRIDGFADRETVAQAAVNAAS
jgi:hypothetical protein